MLVRAEISPDLSATGVLPGAVHGARYGCMPPGEYLAVLPGKISQKCEVPFDNPLTPTRIQLVLTAFPKTTSQRGVRNSRHCTGIRPWEPRLASLAPDAGAAYRKPRPRPRPHGYRNRSVGSCQVFGLRRGHDPGGRPFHPILMALAKPSARASAASQMNSPTRTSGNIGLPHPLFRHLTRSPDGVW